jgi:hypothetical protein
MGSRHLIIVNVACPRLAGLHADTTAKARIFRGAKRRDWHIGSLWAVHDDVCDWGEQT